MLRTGPALVLLLFLAACAATLSSQNGGRFTEWTRYEGEPGATHFSALDQINLSNVDRLEVVWTYESPGALEINPIIIDSIMYVIDDTAVVARHAATGRPIWSATGGMPGAVGGRGVVYWESEDRSDRRILFVKGSFSLLAVDALTGEPISSFGQDVIEPSFRLYAVIRNHGGFTTGRPCRSSMCRKPV